MKLRRPSELKTQDRALAAWATDVLRALRELQDLPFLEGRRIDDTALTTVEAEINHGLGRKPRGYFVLNQDAGESVFQSTPATDVRLYLTATGNVTVDLWVF